MRTVGVHVREARAADKPTFFHLWKQLVQINEKNGSDIRATDQSLRVYEALFDAYVTGKVRGVAILAFDGKQACGALMNGQGQPGLPFEVSGGERSHGWGTYVDQRHQKQGIGTKMCDLAARRLRDKGIDEVWDMTLADNDGGVAILDTIGSKPKYQISVLPLSSSDGGNE